MIYIAIWIGTEVLNAGDYIREVEDVVHEVVVFSLLLSVEYSWITSSPQGFAIEIRVLETIS